MTATMEFTLPTEVDEIAELAAVGVRLAPPSISAETGAVTPPALELAPDRVFTPAEIDATASEMLRRMAGCQRALARLQAAESLELQRVRERYARQVAAPMQALRTYEAFVHDLAAAADFGKKASRDVGFGTFGRRQHPARVSVVDSAAAVAWAKAEGHEALVEAVVVEKLPHKAVAPLVLAMVAESGEVPPGFDYVGPTVTYFAKPDVGAASEVVA